MRNAGYTLIELLVVLMLMAILAAIAWPTLRVGLDRFALEEASWRLAREIRQVQQQAIVREEAIRIQFQYKLRRCVIASSPEIEDVFHLPTGISMEGTTFRKNEVVFHPSGSPSSGGTVTLVNDRGEKRFVMVTVGAGRVRVAKEL